MKKEEKIKTTLKKEENIKTTLKKEENITLREMNTKLNPSAEGNLLRGIVNFSGTA